MINEQELRDEIAEIIADYTMEDNTYCFTVSDTIIIAVKAHLAKPESEKQFIDTVHVMD